MTNCIISSTEILKENNVTAKNIKYLTFILKLTDVG